MSQDLVPVYRFSWDCGHVHHGCVIWRLDWGWGYKISLQGGSLTYLAQAGVGCWQEASVLLHMDLAKNCLSVLMLGGYLPPEWYKRLDKIHEPFVASTMPSIRLCCSHRLVMMQCRGRLNRSMDTRRQNHWGPPSRLAIAGGSNTNQFQEALCDLPTGAKYSFLIFL